MDVFSSPFFCLPAATSPSFLRPQLSPRAQDIISVPSAVTVCSLGESCLCCSWLEQKVAAGVQILQLCLLQTLGEPTRRFPPEISQWNLKWKTFHLTADYFKVPHGQRQAFRCFKSHTISNLSSPIPDLFIDLVYLALKACLDLPNVKREIISNMWETLPWAVIYWRISNTGNQFPWNIIWAICNFTEIYKMNYRTYLSRIHRAKGKKHFPFSTLAFSKGSPLNEDKAQQVAF